ncbi:MAG: 5'-nucleotidase SurE, partial [Deltaproteobacteria bacterium]|nr:5'-nucleotidase SurE [Deltaproteobacteria bacterium]
LVQAVVQNPLPRHALLNVNFPAGSSTRFAVTCLGQRNYGAVVHEKTDPRGRNYYWIGGGDAQYEDIPGSDCNAVFKDGLVSLTPLNIDLTDHALLDTLRTWEVPGYSRNG